MSLPAKRPAGKTYRFERAIDAAGPWSTLTSITVPEHGIIEYEDMELPPGQAFYRTVQTVQP